MDSILFWILVLLSSITCVIFCSVVVWGEITMHKDSLNESKMQVLKGLALVSGAYSFIACVTGLMIE